MPWHHGQVALADALRPLLRLFGGGRRPEAEKPLRAELLSIERLEERARALAASFTLARDPRRKARPFFSRLEDNARVLRKAYRVLADDVHGGEFVPPAAEWLLDNFHLIEAEIRGIRHDLPRQYYLDLPKLASREMAGIARVYAMALELIRHTDGRLDRQQLVRFMAAYQTVAPLTIGELWAWPSMVKLALIENLRRLADEALQGRDARLTADGYLAQIGGAEDAAPLPSLPEVLDTAYVVRLLQRMREYGPLVAPVRAAVEERLAAQGMTAEDSIRTEHQRQAAGQVSVANAITSLRLCSTLDWMVFRERQLDRTGPATRPGRRLREHGLPQPGPLPAGGGGTGRGHRGGPAPCGPSHRGERPPGRRTELGPRPRCPRGLPPDREGPTRPRNRRGLPSAPREPRTALHVHPRHQFLPWVNRTRHRRPAGPGRRVRPGRGRRPVGAGLDRSAPPPAGQRVRHRPRPAAGRAPRTATAPPSPRLPGRGPRGRADHGCRPHAAHERGRGGRAGGACGGPGPGERRPAHTLRDPRRFRRRPHGRDAGRRRDPGRRPRWRRRLERPPRPGAHRPVPPVPSCASVEPRRELVDRLGAQAREARRVQPPAAGG